MMSLFNNRHKEIGRDGNSGLSTDYRQSHLAPEKGKNYHAEFSDNPYRSMIWQMEKALLNHIMDTFYANHQICHLDFACGTGRILEHCEKRAEISLGVDLSPSMLEVARKNVQRGELIQADLTVSDVLGERKFNLITAFRFFPNAQPVLRMAAMRVLVKHLDDDGCIVFNNHKNTSSTRNHLARMLGRKEFKGMSAQEVRELLVENDLRIAQSYPLSIFPASESRMLLPQFLLEHVERCLCRIPVLRNLGENMVFVCKRSDCDAF